jgi:hypothetical protein
MANPISLLDIEVPEPVPNISLAAEPSFPDILDSTMLATARMCPSKFFYSYCNHLRPLAPNPHFHSGKALAAALHRARDAYGLEGRDARTAEALGWQELVKQWGVFAHHNKDKTYDNTEAAYAYYLRKWPLDTDPLRVRVGMAEVSGAVELNATHPTTGQPLLYGGKIDCFGDRGKLRLFVDEKTTARFDARWGDRWSMRAQFLGYAYLLRRVYQIPTDGVLVRGILINDSRLAGLEQITLFREDELDEWWRQINEEANLLVQQYKRMYFHRSLGGSPCYDYGGCEFFPLCTSPASERQRMYGNFLREEWLPLHTEDSDDNG